MKSAKNSKAENHSSPETEVDCVTPISDLIPEKIMEDIQRYPRFFISFYNRQLDGISNLQISENPLLQEHQSNTQLKLRFAESLIDV